MFKPNPRGSFSQWKVVRLKPPTFLGPCETAFTSLERKAATIWTVVAGKHLLACTMLKLAITDPKVFPTQTLLRSISIKTALGSSPSHVLSKLLEQNIFRLRSQALTVTPLPEYIVLFKKG